MCNEKKLPQDILQKKEKIYSIFNVSCDKWQTAYNIRQLFYISSTFVVVVKNIKRDQQVRFNNISQLSLFRAIRQTIGHCHDDWILSMGFESFFEKFPFFVAVSQLVDRVQPVEAVQTAANQKDTAMSVFKHSYAIYNVLLLKQLKNNLLF